MQWSIPCKFACKQRRQRVGNIILSVLSSRWLILFSQQVSWLQNENSWLDQTIVVQLYLTNHPKADLASLVQCYLLSDYKFYFETEKPSHFIISRLKTNFFRKIIKSVQIIVATLGTQELYNKLKEHYKSLKYIFERFLIFVILKYNKNSLVIALSIHNIYSLVLAKSTKQNKKAKIVTI